MSERGPSRSVPTGVAGLDEVLEGGLRPGAVYVVEGEAGTGKTTLALQFARTGVEAGERVLYFSFSETVSELREIARSHGWAEEGLDLRYLNVGDDIDSALPQTMIEPSELFLPKAAGTIRRAVEEIQPRRLVIDSLSDLRLVSQDLWLFRSQLIHLREVLAAEDRVTLLLDSMTEYSQHLRTVASGIISLKQHSSEFGPARRTLKVVKMRARSHATGPHDARIKRGGLQVYPRLMPPKRRPAASTAPAASGVDAVDRLVGGGLDRGTSVLLLGPSGVGKSILATQYAVAATERGERATTYLFDEREDTFRRRSRSVGLDVDVPLGEGTFHLRRIDPGEMSPGEFAAKVRQDVEEDEARLVIIDSLSGYFHSMPDVRHLEVHLHELLTYLGRHGAISILILGEHNPFSTAPKPSIDLSYVTDTILLFRYFEHLGEMHRALSVYKKRSGEHERLIREIRIDRGGIEVGEPLNRFRGVLTGFPEYVADDLPGESE